jgi:23S rRNA (guanosine2251-2'-O)-methyltransferase
VLVYGRQAVLEALSDPAVVVERVLLARNVKGEAADRIVAAAHDRGVTLQRVTADKVGRISGDPRHDQGVVAELEGTGPEGLADWLTARPTGPLAVLLLDGVTNPGNVGMVIRTATAAGLDGVVLPHAGSPDVGPLVVRASAGVALRATILTAPTAAGAANELRSASLAVVGLRAHDADDLFTAPLPDRAAYVLGAERDGVRVDCDEWRRIPMSGGVESLNIAVAAALVAYEVTRRRA